MNEREELVDFLSQYFGIGDSYHYVLNRVKEAFAAGTMGLDDFEEYSEETISDIVEYLIENGVIIQKQACWVDVTRYNDGERVVATCSNCHDRGELRTKRNEFCLWEIDSPYCPNCGSKMGGADRG